MVFCRNEKNGYSFLTTFHSVLKRQAGKFRTLFLFVISTIIASVAFQLVSLVLTSRKFFKKKKEKEKENKRKFVAFFFFFSIVFILPTDGKYVRILVAQHGRYRRFRFVLAGMYRDSPRTNRAARNIRQIKVEDILVHFLSRVE